MTRYGGGRPYRGRNGPLGRWILAAAALGIAVLTAWFWQLDNRESLPDPLLQTLPQPAVSSAGEPEELPGPPQVKGIYLSGPMAGSVYLDDLIRLVEETELNAMVIDVKNDDGRLTYRPERGTAAELEIGTAYIEDLPGLVSRLKEKNIYTIARVVAFKDPALAKARPEWALRRSDGTLFTEGGGSAWVNPYEPGVRDYLTEIALAAAESGFDEVQFDYVRFPTGKNMSSVEFGPHADGVSREEAIVGFLAQVRTALHEQNAWLSADVFGTVISSRLDGALIGQDYAAMAQVVDLICPMIYPSHYASGAFGLDVPDAQPYQTIFGALQQSQAVLNSVPEEERAGVRAWLQGFTATWVAGHITYGGEELRAQIQAVYDAGYTDWIIWNAQNRYTADGLLPAA